MQGGRRAQPNSDGRLDVVRLVVFLSLVGDVASSLIVASFGVSGLGRTTVASNLQSLLLVAAVAACLWGRARLALILSGLAVVLVFVLGPTGAEPWLVLVTGVTIAARAPVRLVLLGALAQVGYALAYGLDTERRRPGSGWQAALISLAFTGVAFLVGLLARRLLQARDAWRERVQILQRQNAQIRTAERLRLADDLQVAVIRSLADIDGVVVQLDGGGGPDVGSAAGTVTALRRGLDRIDGLSRSLSAELRTLLDVLRLDVDPQAGRGGSSLTGQRRWARIGRAARACWSAGCVVLAAALALMAISVDITVEPRPAATVVQVLTLLATAVVVWRPIGGAALAGAALVISPFVSAEGAWDLLPAALLCLFVTVRWGPRRLWTVALGVMAYGVLVQVAPVEDSLWRTVAVAYITVLAVITGLVARHLVQARRTSRADVDDLLDERARIEVQERDAVARELHDVVAHQLSVVNLLIMATSASEDPTVLRTTLDKVGRSTGAARQELTGLLATMRRSVHTDGVAEDVGPLVSLRTTLDSLGESLTEQGHRLVVRLDPLADDLDSTTRRTLNRIVQEATTNILRYAPAGSVSRYSLKVGGGAVELEISSPNPTTGRVSDLSSGWGLRGIRERVELLHGTFRAGPQRDRWVVAVSLPLLSGAPVAATVALA